MEAHARYQGDWDELATLVRRARKSPRRLTPADRERLDELYRRITVHLSRATTRTNDHQLIDYLNRLAASAHSVIYLAPRESMTRRIGRFATEGFARSVARSWPQHLISAALVIGGGLVGYVAASSDEMLAHALWPRSDVRQPGSTPDQLLAHLRQGRDESGGSKFLFASFLYQNNLKVGLLAMATGVLASIPTVLLMIFNGMILGTFVAIHHQAGINSEMWAWILPHGITEIGAIMLCGGVGLMLGRAVVQPAPLSRKLSLLKAGREAGRVSMGVAGMLVAAAVIESYVRQSHWSTSTRLVFAGATALFWTLYFVNGYRRERNETQSSEIIDEVPEPATP